MPEKEAFDHRRHLIDENEQAPPANTDCNEITDDEALARMLQEQILEEERAMTQNEHVSNNGHNYSSQSEPLSDDAKLMLELQRQEMDNLRNSTGFDDRELARRMQQELQDEALNEMQMQSNYQDQLYYAQQIRERASDNALTNSGEYSTNHSTNVNDGTQFDVSEPTGEESDLEIAQRMQQLEQFGLGRMNSTRNYQVDAAAQQQQPPTRSRQEEEDARLARLMHDTGKSMRNSSFGKPTVDSFEERPVLPPARENRSNDERSISGRDQHQGSNTNQLKNTLDAKPHRSHTVARANFDGSDSANIPGDLPMNLGLISNLDDSFQAQEGSKKEKKKKFGIFARNNTPAKAKKPAAQEAIAPSSSREETYDSKVPPKPKKPTIPLPIPSRPKRQDGPLPYSSVGSRRVQVPVADMAVSRKKVIAFRKNNQSICSFCEKPATSFLVALEKKYHPECFKCVGCHQVIDSKGPFAYMVGDDKKKHPLHRKCYAELYGVKCAVCMASIPAGPDGKVSFVKHPFFDKEQMCPSHAKSPGRRCTGCHRFEPEREPFADTNDSGRCVCHSCCRSVVVDSDDAQPLWDIVIKFMEEKLHLPIWKDLRKVPILIVGYEALNNHMQAAGAVHGGSSQILTRGLCLTEHQSGRKVRLAKMKFNKNNQSFESVNVEERGYTFFQVPDATKVNPDASVTAILCLSGLPRDLTASVLAHEATHAWFKVHPRFDIANMIPPQVEEGCAQLVAMLFLTEGLEPASTETYGDTGPSDEKLRQYFKFSIETDDNEIYGEGYRKAAAAYADIGIEALLSHVVLYQNFPKT
mmetsp:Transcript_1667/g.2531  ORF Transcript_1667/g.2531 Transcript_1667/m.2531 type:complete len:810 (-) Transcript_1667:19-2448(-)